ncbi:hypothetical protein XELAEV_18001718mg [Xenopus laevis]|nr:hypothetical protein XELAEV_18001718mg [Xenopus laevis]
MFFFLLTLHDLKILFAITTAVSGYSAGGFPPGPSPCLKCLYYQFISINLKGNLLIVDLIFYLPPTLNLATFGENGRIWRNDQPKFQSCPGHLNLLKIINK